MLRRIVAAIVRARLAMAAQRAYRHLETMDDHMLRDIGLTRADVRAIIRANAAALLGGPLGPGMGERPSHPVPPRRVAQQAFVEDSAA